MQSILNLGTNQSVMANTISAGYAPGVGQNANIIQRPISIGTANWYFCLQDSECSGGRYTPGARVPFGGWASSVGAAQEWAQSGHRLSGWVGGEC